MLFFEENAIREIFFFDRRLVSSHVRCAQLSTTFSTTEQALIFMGTFAVQAVGIAIFSTAENPKSNIGSENGGNSSSSSSTENNSNNSNGSSASGRRDNEVDEKTPLVRASSSSSP